MQHTADRDHGLAPLLAAVERRAPAPVVQTTRIATPPCAASNKERLTELGKAFSVVHTKLGGTGGGGGGGLEVPLLPVLREEQASGSRSCCSNFASNHGGGSSGGGDGRLLRAARRAAGGFGDVHLGTIALDGAEDIYNCLVHTCIIFQVVPAKVVCLSSHQQSSAHAHAHAHA